MDSRGALYIFKFRVCAREVDVLASTSVAYLSLSLSLSFPLPPPAHLANKPFYR